MINESADLQLWTRGSMVISEATLASMNEHQFSIDIIWSTMVFVLGLLYLMSTNVVQGNIGPCGPELIWHLGKDKIWKLQS